MTYNKPMQRHELVSEISKAADIRRDVVDDVLRSLTDVAVEEIVNNGAFRLPGVVIIRSSKWKGYKLGGHRDVADHERLRVKISTNIRDLFKLKRNKPQITIDRSNWPQVLKQEVLEKMGARKKNSTANAHQSDGDMLDEFLDDDEE